jgi:two-component system KDP operon response regulator KdpE
LSGHRILIVDDEPQILRFLRPALTAADYDVIEAETGAQAIQKVATAAPDIVILDLGLPDMDGKDVIARLRGWSEIPIIILSARDREAEKIAALDLGADDYIEKPASANSPPASAPRFATVCASRPARRRSRPAGW